MADLPGSRNVGSVTYEDLLDAERRALAAEEENERLRFALSYLSSHGSDVAVQKYARMALDPDGFIAQLQELGRGIDEMASNAANSDSGNTNTSTEPAE